MCDFVILVCLFIIQEAVKEVAAMCVMKDNNIIIDINMNINQFIIKSPDKCSLD